MKFTAILSAVLKPHKVCKQEAPNALSASSQTAAAPPIKALNSDHADFGQSMTKTSITG